MRKDFLIDHIQVRESGIWGADAVLLIVAILDKVLLGELLEHVRSLGMDALVEVHSEVDAENALHAGADLIGINNRNLRDFSVSLETTLKLRQLIPPEIPVVSESGIHGRQDIEMLCSHGVSAVLVGESLVTARDRKAKLGELLVNRG